MLSFHLANVEIFQEKSTTFGYGEGLQIAKENKTQVVECHLNPNEKTLIFNLRIERTCVFFRTRLIVSGTWSREAHPLNASGVLSSRLHE